MDYLLFNFLIFTEGNKGNKEGLNAESDSPSLTSLSFVKNFL